MIYTYIDSLVNYAVSCGLAEDIDRRVLTNRLLDILRLDDYIPSDKPLVEDIEEILGGILDYAVSAGLCDEGITARDIFDTRIMGAVTPMPREVAAKFRSLYAEDPVKATDWYYKLSCDTDYIRRYRIAKDMRWKYESEYGELDITINLSKPEKDPKEIAKLKNAPSVGYPKCMLCVENPGYAGRSNFPARQNHRIVPVNLAGDSWYLQYSPYAYYEEHCIVLNSQHVPMQITRGTFERLFSFVEQFPHYFLGSNADLPIVGGSILNHDHFQGGRYEFPMDRAAVRDVLHTGKEGLDACILDWPMSALQLSSADKSLLIDEACRILAAWRAYSDPACDILAHTDGTPHNTITPILRNRDGLYQLTLVLRNNRTSDEHPLGIFHPHAPLHHIKKENIGLIEVMGLAILPARLKTEMALLAECLTGDKNMADYPELEQHAAWAKEIAARRTDLNKDNVDDILKEEIGHVFVHVLEDAGVYKCTDEGRAAFQRFIATL